MPSKNNKTSFEDFQLDNLKIQNELTPQSEEIRSAVEDDKTWSRRSRYHGWLRYQ